MLDVCWKFAGCLLNRVNTLLNMRLVAVVPGGLIFYRRFFQREISEMRRPVAVKLCHMIAMWLNFIGNANPKIRCL